MYQAIEHEFVAGQLAAAYAESERLRPQVGSFGAAWQARFELLRARILVYQGRSQDAVGPLEALLPGAVGDRGFAISRGTLLSIALRRTGSKARAEAELAAAEKLCTDEVACREVRLAQGIVALEGSQLAEAELDFKRSETAARACNDAFVQMQALLDLGTVELRRERYDTALERFAAASNVARSLGAGVAIEKATGNVGWALYKLGDYRRALENSNAAYEQAAKLGVPIDEVEWLNDAGLSQYRLGELGEAKGSFERSLALAESIQNAEEISSATVALAALLFDGGDLAGADARAAQAQGLAERQGDSLDTLRPRLIRAMVLAKRGPTADALAALLEMHKAADARLSIRWETEKALAELMAKAGDARAAESWFRRAIATYREQRTTVAAIDLRLPFVENGAGIFDSYMEFLIEQGRTDEALQVLDEGRAESLMEEMEPGRKLAGVPVSATSIARQRGAVLLVYCVRPKVSYLWAVGGDHTAFARIAGKETLIPLLERYQRATLRSQDLLSQQRETGTALYGQLVAPVRESLVGHDAVYVIADGGLEQLNFETLIVPEQAPHFWIEDVSVEVAPSIRVLTKRSEGRGPAVSQDLLMVGDPVYNEANFARLPHAREEMTAVADQFAGVRREVLAGDTATPEAYVKAEPGRFGYIHFVAHSVVSASAPLDSAVVLSGPAGQPDAYKLYARDVMASKLHAELVTISSCYSSGTDSYSREGLVGLSWAFLRAGAHRVIGALWQVNDVSTPQLMGKLYQGTVRGEAPSRALRDAKLEMLHSQGVFRKAFYWAPFQVYAGN